MNLALFLDGGELERFEGALSLAWRREDDRTTLVGLSVVES